jgi:hypothetical protein
MANGKTNHDLLQEIVQKKDEFFVGCRSSDDYVQAMWEFEAYLDELLEEEES